MKFWGAQVAKTSRLHARWRALSFGRRAKLDFRPTRIPWLHARWRVRSFGRRAKLDLLVTRTPRLHARWRVESLCRKAKLDLQVTRTLRPHARWRVESSECRAKLRFLRRWTWTTTTRASRRIRKGSAGPRPGATLAHRPAARQSPKSPSSSHWKTSVSHQTTAGSVIAISADDTRNPFTNHLGKPLCYAAFPSLW